MEGKFSAIVRNVGGIEYRLGVEHLPRKTRPVLVASIGNGLVGKRYKVAEITDEDMLREVVEAMFYDAREASYGES